MNESMFVCTQWKQGRRAQTKTRTIGRALWPGPTRKDSGAFDFLLTWWRSDAVCRWVTVVLSRVS
jgi:hypothetical protein